LRHILSALPMGSIGSRSTTRKRLGIL
jgi:hypothetical protein